jgi:curved DNA-binding protein CbpA
MAMIPRPLVRMLPSRVGQVDAHVFSFVDGIADESAIASASGMRDSLVRHAIERLIAIRAVAVGDEENVGVLSANVVARLRELNVLRRTGASYYEWFNLAPSADRRAIKKAYFELAAVIHPDRYFNKDVGDFREDLADLFRLATEGQDVLSDRERRAQYDATLGAEIETLEMAYALRQASQAAAQQQAANHEPSTPSAAHAVVQATTAIPESRSVTDQPVFAFESLSSVDSSSNQVRANQAAASNPHDRAPAGSTAVPAATNANPRLPAAPAWAGQAHASRPVDEEAKRLALAAKLRGKLPPPRAKASSVSDAGQVSGVASLRHQYESKRDGRAAAILAHATDLAAKGQTDQAIEFLKNVDRETPLPALQAKIVELENSLGSQKLKSAVDAAMAADEKHSKDTSSLWQRVLDCDPRFLLAHRRLAEIAMQSGAIHTAAAHARKAVELAPADLDAVLLLARIYAAANLTPAAKHCYERVLQLHPGHEAATLFLAKMGRT